MTQTCLKIIIIYSSYKAAEAEEGKTPSRGSKSVRKSVFYQQQQRRYIGCVD
jgi:hypothetical protein